MRKEGLAFLCFSCYRTQTDEGRYEIKTWHPIAPDEVIEGEITTVENDGEKAVRVKLDGEHGGCWNVAPMLSDDEGVNMNYLLSQIGRAYV